MSIIKKRPRLALSVTEETEGGRRRLQAVLTIVAEEPVPLDWIRATFEGEEWGAIGSGSSRRREKASLCAYSFALSGEQELPTGTHKYPFEIPLVANLPPTIHLTDADTCYRLNCRLSIPWWPDAKIEREIILAASAPAKKPPGPPLLLATHVNGPPGTDPYIEASFARSVFAEGEPIRGAVSLRNLAHHRCRSAVLELVRVLDVRVGSSRNTSKESVLKYALDVTDATDNEQLNFKLDLNKALEPTWSSSQWTVRWQLKVSIDIAWRVDPHVAGDVFVVEPRFQAAGHVGVIPAVGAQRLEKCWQEVADSQGLELIGSAIRAGFGRTSLSIWRERGSNGAFLVGQIDYPSLGLGLELKPASGFFSGAGRKGVLLGDRSWDGAHLVEARDIEQSGDFLRRLPSLLNLRVHSMSDQSFVVHRPGTGNHVDDLLPFVEPLVRLAESIEAERKNIAPPKAASAALPVWKELATALNGKVNPANLSIAGRFHSYPVTVAASWSVDGTPTEIVATLELRDAVDPALELIVVPAFAPTLPAGFPGAGKELIESLTGVASRLEIRGPEITAACEWLADPRHVSGVLTTLSELAAVLLPATPFR